MKTSVKVLILLAAVSAIGGGAYFWIKKDKEKNDAKDAEDEKVNKAVKHKMIKALAPKLNINFAPSRR